MQLPASFSLPKLIPLSQVWKLESKSSMSQFAQLQVRRGGVTQSINQNKITKCAISKKLTCQVAEQMTLLDSQLFQRIDSAELLTWVQEQVPLDFITSIMIIIVRRHSNVIPCFVFSGQDNLSLRRRRRVWTWRSSPSTSTTCPTGRAPSSSSSRMLRCEDAHQDYGDGEDYGFQQLPS